MVASVATMVDSLEIMAASVVTMVYLVATLVALVAAVVYWQHYLEAIVVNLQALVGLVDTVAALAVMDPIGGHQGKDSVAAVISESVTFWCGLFILDINTKKF